MEDEEEVRELKLFAVCGGRQTTRGSAAECIEVRLIKAITQSTCLISSIRRQMKKLPNMLLFAVLIRMLG